MSFIQKFSNQKISSLGIIKIVILIFVSIYLMGNFAPFYQAIDAYLYGFGAINLANGSYEYTNEFLQNPEYSGFNFDPFVKTIHGTLIPIGGVGIYGLAAFSYILGGNYALLYLGPIITILFFITTERVITKLFGGFAGLVALIFLSTDVRILQLGRNLLTDSLFSLLLILGCFFLINFLKEKKYTSILLCSCFLTIGTFFRFNGAIFLPIEILIVFCFVIFDYIKTRKQDMEVINLKKLNLDFLKPISKKEMEKILKLTLYVLGPWSIFFIFLFSFNSYFFDDPFTNYLEQRKGFKVTENIFSSLLLFDSDRFESIKAYSAEFLPDRTNFLVQTISLNSISLDQFLLSIISFSLLLTALFLSLKYKISRNEIIVFILFILGLLLFYSLNPVVSITTITERYMLPVLSLSFGIIGFLMYRGWNLNFQKISLKYENLISNSWKGFLIIIFSIFLLSSLYFSDPVNSIIIKRNFEFKNPQVFAEMYPLELEELPEKSIILRGKDRIIIWEYNAIPFEPFRGYDEKLELWKDNRIHPEPIKIMNDVLDKGYGLYVFKEKNRGDPTYYRYLEDEHGLILKEHSETFCKLVRIENVNVENNTQIKSDDICHTFSER